MANQLAAPMIAAANAEKQRQEKQRAAVEAVTPRRHSTRPSAQQTRKLLAKQAQQASEDFEEQEEDRLLSSGEDAADSEGPPRFKRQWSRAEEDDYDPVADMSEQEGGSEEEAAELDTDADQISEVEEQGEVVYKRPRNSKASATRAGGSGRVRVSLDRAPFPVGDSSDEDAELQQAIAMSLMEAHPEVAHTDLGHPNLHAAPSERSTPGTDGQKGTASALPPLSPDLQEEAGAAEQGAANKGNTKRKGRGWVGDEGVQQEVPKGKARAEKGGGGRMRAPAPLDASHENVQSAFAMLAGSKSAITANSLKRVCLAQYSDGLPSMLWMLGASGHCIYCN